MIKFNNLIIKLDKLKFNSMIRFLVSPISQIKTP